MLRDAAPAPLPMTLHIQQYPGQRRARTRRSGAKMARRWREDGATDDARAASEPASRAMRARSDRRWRARAASPARAKRVAQASAHAPYDARGHDRAASPPTRGARPKTCRGTRFRADMSHADSAASHQICASLRHRASSARGAKTVHVGAMPRRVSCSAFWHGICLAIFGESTTIRFAAPNIDPPGNGLPGQRRPTHPVTRPGSQDAVFVW
ncbi:hypothetical protein [Burkholderia mayonis]|nr:hypothetical protein [Burkholderia mayonis]